MTAYLTPYGTEEVLASNLAGLKNVASASTSSTSGASDLTVSETATAASYTLAAPVTGKQALLGLNSTTTSTHARTWTLVSGTIQTTASSTYTSVTLNGTGQFASLIAISTSRWHSLGASAAAVFA
jgi:hypothetical protein